MNNNKSLQLTILSTPGFLLGLALLLLNDFYLKQAYGNLLTGKLSDFAGLFTFSLFLAVLLPNRVLLAHLVVAATFIWWKSPLSDGFIHAWNSLGWISFMRTVDYSDYVALIVLPLSYAYFTIAATASHSTNHKFRQAAGYFVILISVFAFTATSTTTSRTLTLPEAYSVQESRVEIEGILLKDARIKNLVPRVERKAFVNNAHVRLDKDIYFFDFDIDEPTCDSPVTKVSMLIREEKDHTELHAVTIRFDCEAYGSAENINSLQRTYLERSRSLFRSHVLGKLTPAKTNDKTPSP